MSYGIRVIAVLLGTAALSLPLPGRSLSKIESDTQGVAPSFANKMSSGLFSLPANAKSVDWAVMNGGVIAQQFRVTVFKCGIGAAKVPVSPGPLTETINPGFTFHNANSVGAGKPFVPGFYYEVVIENNDTRLHPMVEIWQDSGGTVIPGTLIPSGVWVQTAN